MPSCTSVHTCRASKYGFNQNRYWFFCVDQARRCSHRCLDCLDGQLKILVAMASMTLKIMGFCSHWNQWYVHPIEMATTIIPLESCDLIWAVTSRWPDPILGMWKPWDVLFFLDVFYMESFWVIAWMIVSVGGRNNRWWPHLVRNSNNDIWEALVTTWLFIWGLHL